MPRLQQLLAAVLLTLVCLPLGSAQAQQLTGITVFSTDASGNIITTATFNTFGGDNIPNIYVINDPIAQTFHNSGDSGGTGAPTGINLSLSMGLTQFFASVDPLNAIQGTFYGINLFFNGNNATPGISAFTTINTPTGVANGGMTLANTGGLTLVPGANTLTYNDPSGNQVILSLFNYASTRVSGLPTDFPEDLVGPFSLGANGTPDNYVDFTLTVIPIPEPSAWALLIAGAVVTAAAVWRRRAAMA